MIEQASALTRIRTASTRLERALAPVEAVFLDAGGQLAAAVDHLGKLTEGFAALACQLEDSDSVAALTALEGVSARLGSLGASTQASQQRLAAMHARGGALDARLSRLRKVIGEVRVLAVNAKVEAAHVTVRDVDFSVFTREIGRLADLAGASLEQLGGELATLSGDMVRVQGGLDAFVRDHRHSLADVGARLATGLGAAAARKRDSAHAIRALAEVSRHMAGEVARTVEALQVGDITRQRAEHVREALATLLDVLDGPAQGDGALPDDHRATLIASVCRLQSAQASQTADDLRQELAHIGTGLRGLVADLGSLPERCASVYGGGAGGTSSFLSELGHDLEEAHLLLRRYAEAEAQVNHVIGGISAVVEGMVHHIENIRSIEADMRVMGLNATFKCGRLGDQGRALSVIAQELRGYSNRTAEEGRAIMAELGALIADARTMDEDEAGGCSVAGMEADMADAVARLDAVGARSSTELSALNAAGRHAVSALERAGRLLDAHPEFVTALAEGSLAIAAVAEEFGREDGDITQIREEVLELLRGRYTMASERKVHEMFGEGSECDPTPPAADDADSFLF